MSCVRPLTRRSIQSNDIIAQYAYPGQGCILMLESVLVDIYQVDVNPIWVSYGIARAEETFQLGRFGTYTQGEHIVRQYFPGVVFGEGDGVYVVASGPLVGAITCQVVDIEVKYG